MSTATEPPRTEIPRKTAIGIAARILAVGLLFNAEWFAPATIRSVYEMLSTAWLQWSAFALAVLLNVTIPMWARLGVCILTGDEYGANDKTDRIFVAIRRLTFSVASFFVSLLLFRQFWS
jgi:hypothetical protein